MYPNVGAPDTPLPGAWLVWPRAEQPAARLVWQEIVLNHNTYIPESPTPTWNPNSWGPGFIEGND